MSVKCYEGVPSVKLISGPSPREGLVVLDSDRYVCYGGFNDKAAELVCGELGFPAAEDYSPQTSPSTATQFTFQRLSCLDGYRYTHIKECISTSSDCPQNKAVRLRCQASAGFCDHPDNLSNGYWDSNVTTFGSEISLICGEGFIINGSATLQCEGIPGRSTYFPVWNSSVPSCRAVGNESDGIVLSTHINNVWQDDPNNSSTTVQNAYSSSNEIHATRDMTTLSFDKTSLVTGQLEIKISIYTLGPLLGVVLILLAFPFMAWCYHNRKRRRYREASTRSNVQSAQSFSPITSIRHRPLPEHPDNRTGDATPHQEGMYHIYQNPAQDHTEMISDSADTISRPLRHGALHQDGEDIALCQNTTANTRKEEQYIDMSGTMEKKNMERDNPLEAGMINDRGFPNPANIISPSSLDVQHQGGEDFSQCQITKAKAMKVQCMDTSGTLKKTKENAKFSKSRAFATEKDIEENHYLNFNGSPVRAKNDGLPYPPAMGRNDSLYSDSIYSSKERKEFELDENGYLVLETCAGETAEDQYVDIDKEQHTTAFHEDKISPGTNLHWTKNSEDQISTAIYDNIPVKHGL